MEKGGKKGREKTIVPARTCCRSIKESPPGLHHPYRAVRPRDKGEMGGRKGREKRKKKRMGFGGVCL